MRKTLIAFGCFLFLFSLVPAEAEVVNYWDYWAQKSPQNIQAVNRGSRTRGNFSFPRSSSVTSNIRTTASRRSSGASRWRAFLANRNRDRFRSNFINRTPIVQRTPQFFGQGLRASVTPITLRQDINDITLAPVDLFQIGFINGSRSRSSDFVEAAEIDTASFEITDNTGIVSDFSDFELVINGEAYDFNRQGFVTTNFRNLRIARSEDRFVNVAIRIEDPDSFPRLPGSFRVKLTEVTAFRELSGVDAPVQLTGRTTSDHIVLNPRPSISPGGGSVANINRTQTIVGRPLGGGESALVATFTINAAFDDFLLEELTVTNREGSNADQLVRQINLIDLGTGRVLDFTRFVNGRANFDLGRNQQVFIPRNDRIKLGLEVQIVSDPNTDRIPNALTFDINSGDIDLFGVGSGRNLSSSQINLTVDAETFTVKTGTLSAQGGIFFSAEQPPFFASGNLNQVARFKIVNGGGRDISLGRISLQVAPIGVALATGTVADFELTELFGGVTQRGRFTTTGFDGNSVTFDTNGTLFLDAGTEREFALSLALNEVGNIDDGDGVALVILGDNGLVQNNLAGVRAAGANFIWSDQSGDPHTENSNDWFSGFQFTGLPSNPFRNARRD